MVVDEASTRALMSVNRSGLLALSKTIKTWSDLDLVMSSKTPSTLP